MGADSISKAIEAARWAGITLDGTQQSKLVRLYTWLCDEAVVAGGIGPYELDRLWTRHIADSLLLGAYLADSEGCLDIGSGVGLPGIPLAIARPDITFDLVDRAGRRCDLMRRAVAVLDLHNCSVIHGDIGDIKSTYPKIVSRAAISAQKIMIHVKRRLKPGGIGLLGFSWQDNVPNPPDSLPGLDVSIVTVPSDILDTDVNLLRIDAT